MQRYLFVPRVLGMVENGNTFRLGVALVLRVAAVGIGLAALISWIGLWTLARFFEPAAILGLVVFQALFIVTAYAILHTIMIRATDIRNRDEGEFVILPIVATCCRLAGECLAWFFCALGVGGALLILLAGPSAQMATSQIPFASIITSPGVGAVGAAVYLVFGIVAGFVALLFFYLVAESSSLLAAIAKNTEGLRKIAERAAS